MNKPSINMIGSCVIRDIFGLHDGDGGYEIRQFLNFVSPLTMFDKAIGIDKERIFSLEVEKICRKWRAKCAYLDMTRGVWDYMKQKEADWFITDTALMRYDLVQFETGELCCRSNNKLFKYLNKKHICPKIQKIVHFTAIPREEMRKRMLKYAESILSVWPAEKVILVEVNNVDMFYDKNSNGIYLFERLSKYHKENEVIKFCFDVLCEAMPGAHIIRMPDNVVGDSLHKWGCGSMHYMMEYYDYALKAIQLVTCNASGANTASALEELRCKYSKQCLKTYGDNAENMAKYEENFRKHWLKLAFLQVYYRLMTHLVSGSAKQRFVERRKAIWKARTLSC